MGAPHDSSPPAPSELRAFVEHVPFGAAMLDRSLHFIATSQLWEQHYGRDRATTLRRWKAACDRALAGDTHVAGEEPWPLDGAPRWIRWGVVPWRRGDNTIGGFVVWAQEVTERRLAEAELRESEQRYTTVFNESPFAIAITRWRDQVFVNANAAFLQLFECTREELIGRTSVEIGFADPEAQAAAYKELLRRGSLRDFEATRVTKSGARKLLSLNIDWITIGGEKHLLTTIRDISELRRAHEAARLYAEAKHLDEIKTRFFAGVSHELRTPLALILGSTERLAARTELSADARQDLGTVGRNARTLLEYVNDLLDVSKLEAGRMTLEYADIDVAQLVRFVASHFEGLASERATTLHVDATQPVAAQIDPDKLRRVLLNLLSNAFKFTPPGGQVRASVRAAGDRIRIEVADSGPGIPSDMRELVFEPFRQVEGGPTGRFGGTGLGLAIANELVTLHRGTISVSDAPEGGALLVIDLPAKAPAGARVRGRVDLLGMAAEIDTTVQTLHDLGQKRVQPAGDRGAMVLVVEDNSEMNRFISESLALDYRVESALDGREGLDKAMALKPDLVLTDIMMPEMSGDELVYAIRRHRELDRTPIVLLTAKTDDRLRVALLRAGAQDYLNKPFSMEELRVRVDSLISRKHADERGAELQRLTQDVDAASAAVSEAVASLPEASVRAVLHTIALRLQTLTAAEYVAVGIGTDPEVRFDPWVAVGMDPARAAALGNAPHPRGVLGLATRSAVRRLRDLRDHPAFGGFPPNHPTMTSFLAVPIRYQGRVMGTVFLSNKRDAAEFSDEDERLVEMLAERVGIAVETARLYRAVGMERTWLQAVIDQMPEAVVLADAGGHVTTQNHAARLFATEGLPGHDSLGLDLRRTSGEPLTFEEIPIFQAIRRQQSTYALELAIHCDDGRVVPVLVSSAPIRMADGMLSGATMVLQDISNLKELERLRQEWASIVAHDLQQPINAIILNTEMLMRSAFEAKDRERLARVRSLTFGLSRMVSDLSDASQLDANRIVVARDRVDITCLIHEIVERVPGAGARVNLRDPARSLVVRGDAARLEQIVANLVTNAIKYSDQVTPIEIEITEEPDCARVAVRNTGAGIPAEELPLLFKRFVRTREARTSSVKGSGLGLYIAKGLVEAHGGRIWVESVQNGATTFYFTIPLASDDERDETSESGDDLHA